MKVNIYRAYLVIRDKEERLTKSIAKQLPIVRDVRWDSAVKGIEQPKPLGKIEGKVIGESFYYLYLIVDDIGNLAWHPVVIPNEQMKESIINRGGWVDEPSTVPTIIL